MNYIFYGLILGVLLPGCISFILKKYENYSAMNQLIFTQGFQPLRTKQIECQDKNFLVIDRAAEVLAYSKLLKTAQLRDARSISDIKEKNELSIFLLKEWNNADKKLTSEQNKLNYCYNESINYSDILAMLLGASIEYIQIFEKLKTKLKNISKKSEDFIISLTKPLNLTTSNNLLDLDKLNNLMLNIDNFYEKTGRPIDSMFDLNVRLREKNYFFTVEYYNAWAEFYNETNKLFIQAYQRRLS